MNYILHYSILIDVQCRISDDNGCPVDGVYSVPGVTSDAHFSHDSPIMTLCYTMANGNDRHNEAALMGSIFNRWDLASRLAMSTDDRERACLICWFQEVLAIAFSVLLTMWRPCRGTGACSLESAKGNAV